MKCRFIKPDGTQCEAQSIQGDEYCFSHNPNTADQKHDAVVRGGQASKKSPPNLPPLQMETVSDAKKLLGETINQVRAGAMDVKVANCIGFLTNHFVKACELSDLQKRIDLIEKALTTK